MDPGITDIASQLAVVIPTGKGKSQQQATDDWRTTIYNAKATSSVRPLTDLIRRSAPGNEEVQEMCDVLRRRR